MWWRLVYPWYVIFSRQRHMRVPIPKNGFPHFPPSYFFWIFSILMCCCSFTHMPKDINVIFNLQKHFRILYSLPKVVNTMFPCWVLITVRNCHSIEYLFEKRKEQQHCPNCLCIKTIEMLLIKIYIQKLLHGINMNINNK